MTLQMNRGRGFNPVGWDSVQIEAFKKEDKCNASSIKNYSEIRGQYSNNHPPAGWAWFNQAGFHDAFAVEPIVKRKCPQMPIFHPLGHKEQSAGLEPRAVLESNIEKHRTTGRHMFMERGAENDLAATIADPHGGLAHLKRTARLSLPAPRLPTPAPSAPSTSRSFAANPTRTIGASQTLSRSDLAHIGAATLSRSASGPTLRLLN